MLCPTGGCIICRRHWRPLHWLAAHRHKHGGVRQGGLSRNRAAFDNIKTWAGLASLA